ncbi:MAG TPA: hypothetical protein VH834_05695 [Solirubrobacteraceae bacterium]|jgi:hypothetical protein
MATFCKTYPDAAAAEEAVAELRAAGVPDHAIRMLAGQGLHDIRREPVGMWARTLRPDAPVGTYANRKRLRRQGYGTFAGDPDSQRKGSFADADRDVVVTYDGGEHAHVAGRQELMRLLHDWHVVDADAEHVIDELHAGHATVVVEISDLPPDAVRARLEEADATA